MGIPLLPEEIETERLRLRLWRFEDVDAVFAFASDAEWARYLPVPQPYSISDAREFIARQVLLDRTVHPSWAILLDDVVAGGINIRFNFDRRLAAVGWSIARPNWRQGLGTEAARAVVGAAFQAHENINRIEATADPRNLASQRIMEKLGMQREGTLRQSRILRNEAVDETYFGILRSEWYSQIQK